MSGFEIITKRIINYSQEKLDRDRDTAEAFRSLINLGAGLWRLDAQASESEGKEASNRESQHLELNCDGN